jgi:hypothetical protein
VKYIYRGMLTSMYYIAAGACLGIGFEFGRSAAKEFQNKI